MASRRRHRRAGYARRTGRALRSATIVTRSGYKATCRIIKNKGNRFQAVCGPVKKLRKAQVKKAATAAVKEAVDQAKAVAAAYGESLEAGRHSQHQSQQEMFPFLPSAAFGGYSRRRKRRKSRRR